MSAQTSYDATPGIGFAGMLAESTNVKQADSYLAEGAILPGYAVKLGTNIDQAIQITANSDTVIGIAVYNDGREQDDAGVVTIKDKTSLAVLKKGRIMVTAGEAVAFGESVFAGVGGEAGKFYNDNGGGSRATVTGATFHTAAAADGDIVVIELW